MHVQQTVESLFRKSFGEMPTVEARAPGRIEFIGNHTDYNGGTVLGASIDRTVTVAVRPRQDGRLVFASDHGGAPVAVGGRPFQRQSGATSWVNYPLGVLVALEARGLPPPEGFELAVASDLPLGAGLSSSAALELASALAVCALQGFTLPREEMVQACREAENRFVGVPCGILDQGVSGYGKRDHLVHIDCRGPVFSVIPLPTGVKFWIFNTHQKHALVDSFYATRHGECMEAARLLGTRHGEVKCLADATPAQVRAADGLLGGAVFKRALHVVEEIARVDQMKHVLAAGDLAAAGGLLLASHESSRTLFENSTPQLDFLVATLRGRDGVWGARLTGGGFGGAVIAMTTRGFDSAAAETVAAAYSGEFGNRPDVITCATADGAELIRG
jgi:galactokinase